MSANDDEEMEIPGREVAYRLFAAEYDDASVSYTESDEERAPNYVIAPTGARINRLFAVGTLTEVTAVNDEMVRARVVDPTGAFVVYAGQYQPDELAFLEGIEPPAFVAVTGKARTFQPEDSDQVYTSIRPESIETVDADTRDRWVVSAAEQTVDRIGTYAAAAEVAASDDELTDALLEAGVEPGLAAGVPLAQDSYGTTPSYLAALRDCALEAVEVVAGERDQVTPFDAQPSESAPAYESATFESLADRADLELDELAAPATSEDEAAAEGEGEPVAATTGGSDVGTSSAAGTATGEDRGSDVDVEVDADSADVAESEPAASGLEDETGAEAGSESAAESEPATDSESEPEPTATFDESDAASEPDTDTAAFEGEDEDGDDSEDDLGDFDAGDVDDGGMYEMDDDEREQLEEQFGAEFTTGSEVEEPGEAGIDVEVSDDAGDVADAETDAGAGAGAGGADADDELGAPPESGLEADESPSETEPDDDEEDESDAETAEADDEPDADEDAAPEDEASADDGDEPDADLEDVDLQDYVVETMGELDDGDGVDRSELVETVASDTGASEDEVEDAIQDALMGGQCYEPDDETLKPI